MTAGLSRGVHHRAPDGGWPEHPVPDDAALAHAAEVVSAAHDPTPMIRSHELSTAGGRSIHLKMEGTSAVRSFKFRGALAAVAMAAHEHPDRAIVTASTGNHGQGVAFAGRRHGVDVTVVSPDGTLPVKRAAMEALGADVVVAGENLSEAEGHARAIADRSGALYIEDGESPHLMAGAATVVSEMLDHEPDLDSIVVPVGGGNLIAASLLAVARRGSAATVVGVQSTEAPGAALSWLAGNIVRHPCATWAGGLATERPGVLSLSVMTRLLGTMVLVRDDDLRAAAGHAFRTSGLVVEGAAAATLAALRLHPDAIPGDRIGLVLSGSWLAPDELVAALQATDPGAAA